MRNEWGSETWTRELSCADGLLGLYLAAHVPDTEATAVCSSQYVGRERVPPAFARPRSMHNAEWSPQRIGVGNSPIDPLGEQGVLAFPITSYIPLIKPFAADGNFSFAIK